MSVRLRDADDLSACLHVLRAVHVADGYPMSWPTDPAGWLSPVGCTSAWVAEVRGTIVGHVCVVGDLDDPVVAAAAGVPSGRLVTVSRLFVAPEAQGQGMGASLLTASCRYAAARGLQLMLDVVDDGGPAVALYERLGWRLIDRRFADWTTPEGDRPPVRVYRAP